MIEPVDNPMPSLPVFRTPIEAYAERIIETVTIGDRELQYQRPLGLDKVFAHPQVQDNYGTADYIPYWCDLWPSAVMLGETLQEARWLAKHPHPCGPILELGCGLGLSGIVALSLGRQVTFSDIDAAAIELATINAQLNGFREYETLVLDWRNPPAGLQFPIIIGADVLYESKAVEPLARLLKKLLEPGGIAFITDPDRNSARNFRWTCEQAGLQVLVRPRKTYLRGQKTKGFLYVLQHAEFKDSAS